MVALLSSKAVAKIPAPKGDKMTISKYIAAVTARIDRANLRRKIGDPSLGVVRVNSSRRSLSENSGWFLR